MKIICWNCQGLGQSRAVRSLCSVVIRLCPDVIFLSDSRLSRSGSDKLRLNLEMFGSFSVDYSNTCSGLLILWNNKITLDLLSYSDRHIDVCLSHSSVQFRFTGLYGYANANLKYKTWELIDRLRSVSTLPWLLGGDFNEILHDNEKQGGRRRNPTFISNFRDCLSRNEIFDCKPSHGWFTWTYTTRFNPSSVIRERLDRFLASTSWFTDFASFDVRTEFSDASDHCILVLDTNFESSHMHSPSSGSFHFEDCWASLPDCVSTVQKTWNSTPGSVLDKLQAIGTNLDHWQHKRRVCTIGRINFLHRKLNRYLERNLSQMDAIDFINAKNELRNLLREQEVYWAQRSRIQWLKSGDKNTRFFHSRASARRKKNHILGLYNSSNTWEEGSDSVLCIASAYFTEIFTSSFSWVDPMILDSIQPTVTPSMNADLTKPFTAEEVTAAFWSIGPDKAPGYDGFPGSFFRRHWDIMGPDIIRLCLDLLAGKTDMALVNRTILVLIPKVPVPERMKQLRPISLCSVIYKIVSKVIVSRMRPILPACIADNQSAFVRGRNIADNILIAHEIIHSQKTIGTRPYQGAAIKLDMEKAFDRVEWGFLKEVMLRMGFSGNWVGLLMRCITTVSFSVRVNGSLSPTFFPERGLSTKDDFTISVLALHPPAIQGIVLEEALDGT
ncbi:hypothetical protein GQ457_05G015000 [Hibiscus cannabinus]